MGTKGILRADPAYGYAGSIKHQVTIGGKTKTKTFPKRDQFAAEIAYFSECVIKDKDPEPSGLEGLADVRVVEAIYESLRTKRPVRLPELFMKERATSASGNSSSRARKAGNVHAQAPSRKAA